METAITVTPILVVLPPATGTTVIEHVPAFTPFIFIVFPDVTVAIFVSEEVADTDLFASDGLISNVTVFVSPTFIFTLLSLGVILATVLSEFPLELLSYISFILSEVEEFPL